MNLKEMKQAVLTLIEEASEGDKSVTEDLDITNKINDVINIVMFELARMKKIPARVEVSITETVFELKKQLNDFFQLERIRYKDVDGNEGEYDIFGNIVEFPKPGTAVFYYWKYPQRITDETEDESYVFELSDDVLQVMPLGVAGMLLMSDVSNNYGQIYTKQYETELQRLDSRHVLGMISFEGGI